MDLEPGSIEVVLNEPCNIGVILDDEDSLPLGADGRNRLRGANGRLHRHKKPCIQVAK